MNTLRPPYLEFLAGSDSFYVGFSVYVSLESPRNAERRDVFFLGLSSASDCDSSSASDSASSSMVSYTGTTSYSKTDFGSESSSYSALLLC